jgi:hypothetical protein
MRRLQSTLLPLAILTMAWSSQAMAFGVGIEGGGTVSYANGLPNGSSSFAGGAALGIIVEEEFDLPLIFLDVWADGQVPTLRLQTGVNQATYLPFDLGLRVGLALAVLHPYVGLFGQMAIPNDDGGGPSLNSPLFGLGGDLGLDIALFIFRFGIEVRGVDMVSTIPSEGSVPNGAWELQGLASVRLSF